MKVSNTVVVDKCSCDIAQNPLGVSTLALGSINAFTRYVLSIYLRRSLTPMCRSRLPLIHIQISKIATSFSLDSHPFRRLQIIPSRPSSDTCPVSSLVDPAF